MTAIAGVMGETEPLLLPCCNKILRELRQYGGETAVEKCDAAALGVTIHGGASPGAAIAYSPHQRYLIAADVRLDNRDELRRSLGGSARMTDVALLAHAWERWGEHCLERLAGDFGIAVLDRHSRALTLARDHTGQRPLFFGRSGQLVAFASMPSALRVLSWLRTGVNLERLAAAALGAAPAMSESYFHDIQKVAPGESISFGGATEKRRLYWHPRRDPLTLSPKDYVDCYHEQLEQAVAPRLGNGLTGLQLSSGYDSSSIAATASRLGANPTPIAFTAAPSQGFDGPLPRGRIGDESKIAALTAGQLGLRHVIVRPSGSMLTNLKRDAVLYQDPDRNVANMHWWSAILDRARETGVQTMLTGQMGNISIHAGGLSVLSEWLRQLNFGGWWKEARQAAKSGTVRWRGILYNSFEPWIPKYVQQTLWQSFDGFPAAGENFLRRDWSDRVLKQLSNDSGPRRSGDLFEDRLAIIRSQDTGVFRLGALAESGIEERDPTADRRLVEFSLNLPAEQLFREGKSRPLARRALEGHLPADVLDARSRGYQAADWYQRMDPGQAHDLIDEISASHGVNELLDVERLRRAVVNWPTSDQASAAARIVFRRRWTLALSVGVFLKEFEASNHIVEMPLDGSSQLAQPIEIARSEQPENRR